MRNQVDLATVLSSTRDSLRALVLAARQSAPDTAYVARIEESLNHVNFLARVERDMSRLGDRLGISPGDNIPSDQQIDALLLRIGREHEADSAIRTILSSLATRIGSVFLIIFLVQILAGLYRYSARMAAHHDSRADILSLGGLAEPDTIALLGTADVDFGRAPRSPTADFKEIAVKALEAIKRRP